MSASIITVWFPVSKLLNLGSERLEFQQQSVFCSSLLLWYLIYMQSWSIYWPFSEVFCDVWTHSDLSNLNINILLAAQNTFGTASSFSHAESLHHILFPSETWQQMILTQPFHITERSSLAFLLIWWRNIRAWRQQ